MSGVLVTGWSERSARLALQPGRGGRRTGGERGGHRRKVVAPPGIGCSPRVRDAAAARAAARRPAADPRGRTEACGARFVIPGDEEWPEPLERVALLRFGSTPGRRAVRSVAAGPAHLAQVLQRSVSIVGSRASLGVRGRGCDRSGSRSGRGGCRGRLRRRVRDRRRRAPRCTGGPGADRLRAGQRGGRRIPARQRRHLRPAGCSTDSWSSELPPGTTPTRVRFLSRNRMIAALSLGTVVVEAALRSGARNTASWAVGCHRPADGRARTGALRAVGGSAPAHPQRPGHARHRRRRRVGDDLARRPAHRAGLAAVPPGRPTASTRPGWPSTRRYRPGDGSAPVRSPWSLASRCRPAWRNWPSWSGPT